MCVSLLLELSYKRRYSFVALIVKLHLESTLRNKVTFFGALYSLLLNGMLCDTNESTV